MFNDIGYQIKILAKVMFWVGVLLSFGVSFTLLYTNEGVVAGIIIPILFGTLFSWIVTAFIYGFGELIEKACSIEKQLRSKNYPKPAKASKPILSQPTICDKCGKETETPVRIKLNDIVGWVDLCEECANESN